MPSKSNKNKWSLPPYPPTTETICIPVTIPNDDRWIGLFLGQLYRLSQQIWYDRDEQHTAKLVAAVWSDIYLETVKRVWACEGDGMFDVRISPEDECSIEKTHDGGETWSEVFRLDSGCSLNRIIRNPSDGSYGFEIEDVGFWRFPDGPPGVNAVNPPVPAPTHAAAPDPLCAAASNAAMVYVELYKRVAAELLDQVAGEFELAANLGTAISGFLMIIGAAATQPYVAIASILGLIGVRQQFLDNPLDSDDLERMTCILYDHAVQDAQGSVTFDYDGVFGDVDLADPKQTLMRLLLGMLGGDALNASGAVDIVASPNCSDCDESVDAFYNTGDYGTINSVTFEDDWYYLYVTPQNTGAGADSNLVQKIRRVGGGCFTITAIEHFSGLGGLISGTRHHAGYCNGVRSSGISTSQLRFVSWQWLELRFSSDFPQTFRMKVTWD